MANVVFLLLEVTSIKMKPKTRKLMEWLARNEMLLESQIVGSGLSKALDDALVQGWAEITAHPTVQRRQDSCHGRAHYNERAISSRTHWHQQTRQRQRNSSLRKV